jgi:hypothetical protein
MFCSDYDYRISFKTSFHGHDVDATLYVDDISGRIHLVIEGLLSMEISSSDVETDSMAIHDEIACGFERWLLTCVHDHPVSGYTVVHNGLYSLRYSTHESRWYVIFRGRTMMDGRIPTIKGMEERSNPYHLLTLPSLRQAVISYFIV